MMRTFLLFLLLCCSAVAYGRAIPADVIEAGITQEEAIAIARKAGCYKTGKRWGTEATLTENDQWVITSVKSRAIRRGGYNGWAVTKKRIWIDAQTGVVTEKERSRENHPSYE
jgi:hypothetical protein